MSKIKDIVKKPIIIFPSLVCKIQFNKSFTICQIKSKIIYDFMNNFPNFALKSQQSYLSALAALQLLRRFAKIISKR